MIIGITGTDGAGKGTVVEFLKKKGFAHYSARDFLLAELKKAEIEPSRNELRLMGNRMRTAHGDEFIAKRAYELIKKDGVENAVIESIRALAEANYIKEKGGLLWAVDADPEIRYSRVQTRRSEKDQVTYEEFLNHEELEKNDPEPHGMQKAQVIGMADYTLHNDGTIAELVSQVEKLLEQSKQL